MTKSDTAIAAGIGLVLLAGGRKAFAKGTAPANAAKVDPGADGAALMKRANQAGAASWVSVFADHPVSPLTAAALARWAGIESSGNPLAQSRLDERGLMQAGKQSVAEGAMSPELWGAMVDKKTSKRVHADIAVAYVDWLGKRAAAHLASDPTDPIDRVWYAKLYHQRPVDVRDVVGPLTKQLSTVHAPTIAAALAGTWANDAKAMHRLRAANVVAFGTPNPGAGPTS